MFGITHKRRQVEDRALPVPDGNPLTVGTTLPPLTGTISPRAGLAIGDVYACVRALADAGASVPLHVFRHATGGRERITGGPLVELLDRPAPATTQAGLVGQLVAHLALHGNAFLAKYRAGTALEQLGLIDPALVQVEIRGGTPRYRLSLPERMRDVGPADILHIRAPLSLDGILGLSPLAACRMAFDQAQALARSSAELAASGGLPLGVLKVSSIDGPESLARLKAGWDHRYRGAENAGRVAVLSGDVDFKPVSQTLDDLAWIEQRQLSTAEIARVFRVPPWVIGAPSGDSMTYSNVEQQGLAFVTYSLRPWLVAIEQAISSDPDLCRQPQYVEFVLDALLRADTKTRAEVYALALDPERGWMSRDEVRRLENLPAVPTTTPTPTPIEESLA